MDEQKELQANSTPSDTPLITAIPYDIPQNTDKNTLDNQKENQLNEFPDIEIPALRTYKSDINHTVNKDKISTAKILIAEQNRQRKIEEKIEETSIKRPTNILVLIISIILITASLGAIGYFGYTKVIIKKIEPNVTAPPSFLFIFDQEKFIEVSEDSVDIQEKVQKEIDTLVAVENETFTDIVFYRKNTETKQNERINSSEFFKLYNILFPTNAKRSISNNFVYGIYKTSGKIEPFLVVGVNDYETMYSSMFVWERTLALDIQDLFPVLKDLFDLTKNIQIRSIQDISTTTQSTSTSLISSSTNIVFSSSTASSSVTELTDEKQAEDEAEQIVEINRTIRFIDTVFSNKDARAVRDPSGAPFFYYSFIDKTKILFAQDPKVLNEISRKIKEKSLVR